MNNAPKSATAARRCYLAILFSDLSDSTRLAGALEAEQYADLLAALRAAYQDVIPKHGGTIVRVQGDGLLAIFGYPAPGEDDGRRATEAALELHEKVRALPLDPALPGLAPLSLHSGVHSGLVLLDEGDVVRGRFELLGNAPNIAWRLSDVAGNDEIFVSEETLGPASDFFHTTERRTLALKGLNEPIAVLRVQGRAPVQTQFEARAQRGLAPFVGRKAELRLLEQQLEQARAGRPRYLALVAGAGLGKTRLADEFLRLAAAAGCGVCRGYCEGYLGAEPLQPFLHMLKALFGLQPAMPGAAAAQCVDAALTRIDPALARYRAELLRALSIDAADSDVNRPSAEHTVAALRELFERLAAGAPLVLFIDDWQWADAATRQVLDAIRSLERCALLVLVATRGFAAGDIDMTLPQIIELGPLGDAESAQTIAHLLPHGDPFVAAEIRRYAGGNPLFIEELCRSAAGDDAERRFGRNPGSAAWLDMLIESRVERLPAEQLELVRSAAVIGNVIPLWLLESITGCTGDDPLLRGLAEQGFVFPGEQPATVRFKHAITRDVIYGAVGLRQRKALHLRIAQALQQRSADAGAADEMVEGLAYHYGAAGLPGEAARFAELAGDKAVAASALDRAKAQYRSALAALDQLDPAQRDYRRWTAVTQRLGLACVFDASRGDLAVFRRAVELATRNNDASAIACAQYWLGYINYALGESRAAVLHCELALAAASRVGDDPLAVQIRAVLGQARQAACDYDGALELLDEAISVKRRHRRGTRPAVGLAYSLACKASLLGDRGLFEQAHACFDEALAAVPSAGHEVEASTRGLHSAVLLWQGRWQEARQSAAEACHIAEQVSSLYSFSMSRAAGAYAAWMLERKPESLQAVQDATAWLEPREGGLFRSLNYGWLADGLVSSGCFHKARQHVAHALQRARQRDLIGVAMACRAMARAAAEQRDRARAERYLAKAMKVAAARGSRHEVAVTRLCHAGIELALGDRSRALGLLDQAEAAFEAMDMRWHLGEARRLRSSA